MEQKVCQECGRIKPEIQFKTLRKRQDGTYKRSNVCNSCLLSFKTGTLSLAYPKKIEYSDHAQKRCKLRQVDISRLTRTLLSIKLSPGKHKYPIPDSPLIVVYEDVQEQRLRTVVTVIVDTNLRRHRKLALPTDHDRQPT